MAPALARLKALQEQVDMAALRNLATNAAVRVTHEDGELKFTPIALEDFYLAEPLDPSPPPNRRDTR
jgi:hypothetical protein